MQRKSSARQKAVTEVQRSAAAQQVLARSPAAREVKVLPVPPSSGRGSGETTLGGHVDRGLTLAALYDIGILERLRLEVRIRLFADLTQSLAWLHANPRLMAAHPHLVVAPSTVVIGLDGVARVDVRAAKKQESDRNPSEADYRAPEVASGDPAADLRADIFSLGVLGWEALAGRRLSADDVWAEDSRAPELIDVSDVPAALMGREREPLRRRAPRAAPKSSGSRSRVPPLSLPEGGEWAAALAGIVLRAMCPELAERPQDCRELLSELDRMSGHLASTQEIAEVVQGISAVDTLCVPLPTLPDVDASCQSSDDHLGFMDRQRCSDDAVAESCAQPRILAPRRVVEAAPPSRAAVLLRAPAVIEPPPSRAVLRLRQMGSGSSGPAWFAAGLFWLAVLGLLAGYAASRLSIH
jgi:hypothetical protein